MIGYLEDEAVEVYLVSGLCPYGLLAGSKIVV